MHDRNIILCCWTRSSYGLSNSPWRHNAGICTKRIIPSEPKREDAWNVLDKATGKSSGNPTHYISDSDWKTLYWHPTRCPGLVSCFEDCFFLYSKPKPISICLGSKRKDVEAAILEATAWSAFLVRFDIGFCKHWASLSFVCVILVLIYQYVIWRGSVCFVVGWKIAPIYVYGSE